MKNVLPFLLGGLALLAVGCEEEETPFIEFDDLNYGAIPRLVEAPSGAFDFFNPDDSEISFSVEFYDENQGSNVSEYTWQVSYSEDVPEELDITPAVLESETREEEVMREETVTLRDTTIMGSDTTIAIRDSSFMVTDTVTVVDTISFTPADTAFVRGAFSRSFGPATVATRSASEFQINDAGLPSATFEFSFNEVLEALGITIDSVNGGQAFAFTATLTKDDGSTFTAANTSTNLRGQPAFSAFFAFNQPIICPSDIAGTYTAEVAGESTDGCCPGTISTTSTVTLEETGAGTYTISDYSGGLYFVWYGPDGGDYGVAEDDQTDGGLATTIVDACNVITIPEFSEFFGAAASASGALDPDSGVINYTFTNGFGDVIRVTLTPDE